MADAPAAASSAEAGPLVRASQPRVRSAMVFEEVIALAENSSDAVVITVASPPQVIVYANPAWERLCGWTLEEVKGRTCKLLQGTQTCQDTVRELEAAIGKHQPLQVRLKNYRKNGSAFLNDLYLETLTSRGHHGVVTHLQGTLRLCHTAASPDAQSSAPILTERTDNERMQQLQQSQPKTVEEAVRQTRHAQVITEADRPYRIVSVNQVRLLASPRPRHR